MAGKNTCIYREKYGGDPYFSYIYITKYGSNSRKNNGTSAAGKWMEFMLPDRADYRAIVLCLLLNRCLEYGKKVCMNKKKIRGDET